MAGPLDGLIVLDLTRILAGPHCTMTLGDMGAEVLKVEVPGRGDDTREWGPPFVNGTSAYFLSVNRNKKSLTLNLKAPKGLQIFKALVKRADIVVENFRPGTMEDLGIGYETLRELNPGLIYCAVSGFGHTGPDRLRPGYDVVVQGESGVMSLTGFPDGPPLKVGISVADLVAGMLAVQGILLGLVARATTGRGQMVDVALHDGMVSLLTYQAGIYFATGQSPGRMGNQHPTIAPYETFPTKDGYMILAVGNDSLWARFCEAVGLEGLAADPRFAINSLRVQNRPALCALIEERLRARTTREWIRLLDQAGVPCGSIKTVGEVLSDPQVVAREMVVEMDHPTAGKIRVTGVPVKLSATPGVVRLPPPLLGQHTDEILGRLLNYNPDEVVRLRREGVI
ncbi:MAG: CoA transferase [Deltaproteobacteria bacterium]|nr:CoA transferase [Deltaproteobacteria bacterium]MBI3076120.1 CoA transferase [Deltaproteobacteria bacterium]